MWGPPEPRELGEAEIRALLRLAQIGWEVTVKARRAAPARRDGVHGNPE
jgi:hypothetical protein